MLHVSTKYDFYNNFKELQSDKHCRRWSLLGLANVAFIAVISIDNWTSQPTKALCTIYESSYLAAAIPFVKICIYSSIGTN